MEARKVMKSACPRQESNLRTRFRKPLARRSYIGDPRACAYQIAGVQVEEARAVWVCEYGKPESRVEREMSRYARFAISDLAISVVSRRVDRQKLETAGLLSPG